MTNRPMLQVLARSIAAILLGVQLASWIAFLPIALKGHADFRQLYTSGFMLQSGNRHNLYDFAIQKSIQDSLVSPELNALPFNHLAYEAILFAPLSLMPYRAAYFAFLALNALIFIAALKMLQSVFPVGGHLFWIGVCFLPVSVALMQGQDSIIFLALFSGAFLQASRGKETSAGFLLGMGFFKFQLVLPIAFLFLCWKRWRLFLALTVTAIAAVGGSLILVGWNQMALYLHSLTAMSVSLNSQANQLKYGISPADMPNLRGLVYVLSNGHVSSFAQQSIIVLMSLVVLVLVPMIARPRTAVEALALAIAASAVVSYHLLAHDWSVLLIPLLAVMSRIYREVRLLRDVSSHEASLLILYLAPLLLMFGRNFFFLGSLPLLAFLAVLLRNRTTSESVGPFRGK
jgi:hypothetical protein